MEKVVGVKQRSKRKESRYGKRYAFEFKLRCVRLQLEESKAGYEGIVELRRLHRELDEALRDSYGWIGLDLGHNFVEVETLPENDRIRFTISPNARKEVLRRLLALNQSYSATQAVTVSIKKKRGKKSTQPDDNQYQIF